MAKNDATLPDQEKASIVDFFDNNEGMDDIEKLLLRVLDTHSVSGYSRSMGLLLDIPFSEFQNMGLSSINESLGRMVYLRPERSVPFRREFYSLMNFIGGKKVIATVDSGNDLSEQIPSLRFEETELGRALVVEENVQKFLQVWDKMVEGGTLKEVITHTGATMTKETAESIRHFFINGHIKEEKLMSMRDQVAEINKMLPVEFWQEVNEVQKTLLQSDNWSGNMAVAGLLVGAVGGAVGGFHTADYLFGFGGYMGRSVFAGLGSIIITTVGSGIIGAIGAPKLFVTKGEAARRKQIRQLKEQGIQVALTDKIRFRDFLLRPQSVGDKDDDDDFGTSAAILLPLGVAVGLAAGR